MGLASQALADKHQNWWHLSSIQLAGGIISVPFILIGSEVFFSQGVLGAILSIILGNLIGLFLGYFFIKMSAHNRLNAIENAKQFIGPFFGRALGFFILVDMIGWIAIGLFDGQKYLQNYEFFSRFSAAPIIGAIGSLFLLPGIKGLKKISISMIFPCFMSLT